jgi:hypothetical protein
MQIATEAPTCPSEAEKKRLIRARQAQGSGQLTEISRVDKNMERSEGQATGARSRQPGSLVKPPHGEH